MFLMLFCSILAYMAHFSEIQLVCDGRTDQWMDQRTNTPSYTDARMHLKQNFCDLKVTQDIRMDRHDWS